ncbi:hypothetical protein LguiB_024328 [Lonicera macranthoides]
MGRFEDYKPAMVMFGLQFTYAGVSLSTRAALLEGMSPRVFVVYRQAIAFLVIAPIAYLSRRKTSSCRMGLKSFCLIFLASLIGVTMNQIIFFEGLYLVSSSIASAMFNLVPAVTFLMAAIVGLEKVNIRRLRSIAKIMGTLFCVSGAFAMALLKGPKLLNSGGVIILSKSVSLLFGSGGENWLLGCLFLFGSSCCWSFWLIIQVPVSKSYPDHLSLSAWLCLMSTIQSAAFTLFFDRDLQHWHLRSYLQLGCCLYSGVVGSAISFFAQAWCVSKRGPLFSAMFNPLNTVIVTFFASIFLHEQIYAGSVVGAFGVIIGLYVVLWGKSQDLQDVKMDKNPKLQDCDQSPIVDESLDKTSCKIDLEEPLLSNNSTKSCRCGLNGSTNF